MSYGTRPRIEPGVQGMNQNSSRVEIDEIPMIVICNCRDCGEDREVLRWYPRRNWERYAKVDILQCPKCGAYCEYKSGKTASFNLTVDKDILYLEAKGSKIDRRELLRVTHDIIDINLDMLGTSGFRGVMVLRDNYSNIAKLFFSCKGLQHIEISPNMFRRYGVVMDEEDLKKLVE